MARTKSWQLIQPGDTLGDMHDVIHRLHIPIAEEHKIVHIMSVRTSGGTALIEAAVQEAGDLNFRYTNKYLTALKVEDERIIAAWSYDERVFGMLEIHIRLP